MARTRLTKKAISTFESIKKVDDAGVEYWSSRDLWRILGYTEYRHFLPVIEKAKTACQNSSQPISDHFEDVLEMVSIGSGAERSLDSIKLSRYACYLTVQNADPSKTIVAQAQTYFAIQTRIAEVQQMDAYNQLSTEEEKRLFLRNEMIKHNIQLADAAKGAGVVEPRDYAIFQNYGYQGLYGGLGAQEIHARKGLKKRKKKQLNMEFTFIRCQDSFLIQLNILKKVLFLILLSQKLFFHIKLRKLEIRLSVLAFF